MYSIKDKVTRSITNAYAIKDTVVKSVTSIYALTAGKIVLVWTAVKDAVAGVFGSGLWNNAELWTNDDIWNNKP